MEAWEGDKNRRFANAILESPADVQLDRASLAHEAQVQRKQEEWLQGRGLR
jgi:hypothetical protein